jgi:hypothetical protein
MTRREVASVVRRQVDARGVAAVARDLGLSRQGLTSFLAGTCREGTACQVEARSADLGWFKLGEKVTR